MYNCYEVVIQYLGSTSVIYFWNQALSFDDKFSVIIFIKYIIGIIFRVSKLAFNFCDV